MIRSSLPRSLSLRARLALVTSLLGLACLWLAAPAVAKKNDDAIGQVAGKVVDREGEALQGIEVKLVALPDELPAGAAVTDRRGEFEITVQVASEAVAEGTEDAESPPPSGTYEIRLQGQGYAPFSNELEVTAGERLDVEITLLDAATGVRNQAIALYNEGAQLHGAGDFDAAARKFRLAIETDPTVAEPYLGLADIALAQGEPEKGLEAIESFLERKPDDAAGQRLAYEIYRALGRMDEAKALAAELGIEAADQDLAIQVYNEGAVASQKGDMETALAKFERAVEMDPNLGPGWAGIASIYFNRGELEPALESAGKAVELQPDHEQSRRIHFLILDGLGRKEAAEAWEAYRQMNQPAALELLYLRADLDYRNDAADSAQRAAERILTIDADYPKAHFLLGKIYSSTDTAKAKAHLETFIALAPEDDPDRELAQEMIGYLQ